MSEDQKESRQHVEAAIALAKQKYSEHKTDPKLFLRWLIDTHIVESKRKAFPDDPKKLDTDMKLARWIIANISKHLHPDCYVSDTPEKQMLMSELVTILNGLVNKLKGLA